MVAPPMCYHLSLGHHLACSA
uniref:Uncharacterized protein n=1 Tax=Arundo donax TaxID=35708 RepID=A0A0A8ZWL2_ARUDO